MPIIHLLVLWHFSEVSNISKFSFVIIDMKRLYEVKIGNSLGKIVSASDFTPWRGVCNNFGQSTLFVQKDFDGYC